MSIGFDLFCIAIASMSVGWGALVTRSYFVDTEKLKARLKEISRSKLEYMEEASHLRDELKIFKDILGIDTSYQGDFTVTAGGGGAATWHVNGQGFSPLAEVDTVKALKKARAKRKKK